MSNPTLPLILISGATATGKTDLAVKLAQTLKNKNQNAEVINADSLLFYRELSIGTAKPSLEERQGIAHHLIDIRSVKEPLNASDYCDLALEAIKYLHKKKCIPILVGGSAFYIRALLKGMYEGESSGVPKSDEKIEEVQKRMESLESEKGWHGIRQELKMLDPASYGSIHENDRYRSLRALEFFYLYEKPISLQKEKMEEAGPYDFSRLRNPHWRLHHIYLEVPKDQHWPLMEKRAQRMLENGLLNEVESLINQGLDTSLKPLQSIGYKECFEALEQREARQGLTDKQTQELAERIYINTRRLAKSQKTFFKKINPKNSYNPLEDHAKIEEDLKQFLKMSFF